MPARVDKPNLSVPLALSYNERGVRGFQNTVTNQNDQRKVNVYYEVTKNSLSGEGNLALVVRPGVADVGTTFGDSAKVTQLLSRPTGTSTGNADFWIYSTSSDSIIVASSSQTTTFHAAANYRPTYVDKVAVNNTDNIVLQLSDNTSPTPLQR